MQLRPFLGGISHNTLAFNYLPFHETQGLTLDNIVIESAVSGIIYSQDFSGQLLGGWTGTFISVVADGNSFNSNRPVGNPALHFEGFTDISQRGTLGRPIKFDENLNLVN